MPEGEKCSKGKKQLWQPSYRNYRGGKRKNLRGIVAMKLPKMKEKKNCDNGVAEN